MPTRTARSRSPKPGPLPELYSAGELAAAAGVTPWIVRQLIASSDIPTVDGEFVPRGEALQAVRRLRSGSLTVQSQVARPGVFVGALLSRDMADRQQGLSALVSTTLHLGVILLVAWFTTVSLRTATEARLRTSHSWPDSSSSPNLDRVGVAGGADFGCQNLRQRPSESAHDP